MGPARPAHGGRVVAGPPGRPGRPGRLDHGAAALEFALVSLLLFSLLFMIFGTAWALWEYQAARSTVREAARLASLGIPDAAAYKRGVLCIGERNGVPGGATAELRLTFYEDALKVGREPLAEAATAGNYVEVRLTYTSSVRGIPFASALFANGDGRLAASAVARIEQLGPADVSAAQTLTASGERCS